MHVFYSRNADQAVALAKFCAERNIQLTAQSLIAFEALDFSLPEKSFDVVFFTSPRAVDYFLDKAQIKSNVSIACIGESTKLHLQKLGYIVHFFGSNGGHPDLVSEEFQRWAGESIVLFPISNLSNKSIQRKLKAAQILEVVVYQTIELSLLAPDAYDVLIFSSPSNARAYLACNTISESQQVAAFGQTTHHFLAEKGITSTILETPSEHAVIEYLKYLLTF